MPTDKQRAASRRNSLLSTGPRTEAGRRRSSLNGVKHGLFLQDITLLDDADTVADHEEYLNQYLNHYQPQSPLEHDAVLDIVHLRVRLRQCARAQSGALDQARVHCYNQTMRKNDDGQLEEYFEDATIGTGDDRQLDNRLLGNAWTAEGAQMDLFSRYQARLANQLTKAIKLLRDLLVARPSGAGSQPGSQPAAASQAASPSPETTARKTEATNHPTPTVSTFPEPTLNGRDTQAPASPSDPVETP